jgi:cytochrome c biogenesis protein CcdA
MDFGLLVSLAGLALIDSTSFGTLGIPLLLVVAQRRVSVGPLRTYFLTVVLFYFAIGIVLLLGLDAIFDLLSDALDSRTGSWIQLVIGVSLFLVSFRIGKDKSGTKPRKSWMPKSDDTKTMVGLGFIAALLEVATMLPYLSATGLLATSDIALPTQIAVLALYCLVMILPALIVIALAAFLGDRIWNRLERFGAWIERESAETIAWIVGIAGFFIAADAVGRLGLA